MASLQIIALDGSLNRDFGWAIPIVQEADVFYLLGETMEEALAADKLDDLASSGDITRLSPVSFELDETKQEAEDLFACRSFGAPVLAFYWREDTAQNLQLDMAQLTSGYTSLNATVSDRIIRLVPLSALIRCLRAIVKAICGQFLQVLAEEVDDGQSLPEKERWKTVARNKRLQTLAEMAYRLAPDRGWAKEAIAQKTLLLMLGDHPASVPTWLSAAAPFWGHPPVLEYWQSAAQGILAAVQQRAALGRIERARALSQRAGESTARKNIRIPSGENPRTPSTGILGKSEVLHEEEPLTEFAWSITGLPQRVTARAFLRYTCTKNYLYGWEYLSNIGQYLRYLR